MGRAGIANARLAYREFEEVFSSDRFVALRDGGMVGLIYLADPALGGRWLTEWDRGLALPYAIGVVRARDTVILRVAPR